MTERKERSLPSAGSRSEEDRFSLLAFMSGKVHTHALPSHGSITLGRGEGCAIRLEDPSVSRRHATLHLGPTLTIEDHGSVNGTRIRVAREQGGGTGSIDEIRLEANSPTPIALLTPIQLGSVAIVIQTAAEPVSPPRSEATPQPLVHAPSMQELYELASRVAQSPLSVLVRGETGSGKELLAGTIHRRSPRAAGPFVSINCGAIAETLMESTLFGYEKGAFTGALQAKPGLIENADGGTLFLDEVGEMSHAVQVKLLRVLEDRQVLRVGAVNARRVDVRFIAATHQDLEAAVARGTFREDLYFRINGFTLTIPPLRARVAEIAALSQHFIQHFASEQGRPPPALTPEAQALLEKHPWPGNIRELRNVMGRAVVLCQGEAIEAEHLIFDSSQRVRAPTPPLTPAPVLSPPQASAHPTPVRTPSVAAEPAPTPAPASTGGRLGDDIAALERQRILAALDQCGGNQTRAAELLGISRRTLVTRLGVYGIPRPRSR